MPQASPKTPMRPLLRSLSRSRSPRRRVPPAAPPPWALSVEARCEEPCDEASSRGRGGCLQTSLKTASPLCHVAAESAPDAITRASRMSDVPETRGRFLAEAASLLVSSGSDLSAMDEDGHCALLLAAMQPGAGAAVRRLLAAGADANQCDGRGACPLSWAAALNGDPDVVAALLDGGADPNLSDEDGITPLSAASMSGRCEVVRLLLKAGANADPSGDTLGSRAGSALSLADSNGHQEVVQLLLEAARDQTRH
ncbi:unnamed protein product [Polarella glacialis]|uniref:Uncharacterized protein n=1 Tax=Polarella glacialis TaxID=89957 RepID=A0A813KUB6_POLGL|nr:unnamed protein product [Polarella glacialis]CAE8712055.1 unnamed protein product [Polarella glacialis]